METMEGVETYEQNIIIWASSWSWESEIRFWDIGTSRSNIFIKWWEMIDSWLDLKNEKTINEWMQNLITNFKDTLLGATTINISMHAMSMNPKMMDQNYPKILLEVLMTHPEIQQKIEEQKLLVNALLISYHSEYSEENEAGSHIYYQTREAKSTLEYSLQDSSAHNKKIIDLDIYDSPSAKAIWFTFLWVAWQFIDFLEANSCDELYHLFHNQLRIFLWKDYWEIVDFLKKYPLKWNLEKWQKSMSKLWETWELKSIFNEEASKINFAKLSYISSIISQLYLDISTSYLKHNKEAIFPKEQEKILLDFNTVQENKYWGVGYDLRTKLSRRLGNHLFINNSNKKRNLVFVENDRNDEKEEINYTFNPTDKNFEIIWNHFGLIPLTITNGMIYDSGLLDANEHISQATPHSPIYTWNDITLQKNWKILSVFNTKNPKEIFVHIGISKRPEDIKNISEKWFVLTQKAKSFDKQAVPHREDWFKEFSQNPIPEEIFGLKIDSKSILFENIGVQLANIFLINPDEKYVQKVLEFFKVTKEVNFQELRWIFSKVNNGYLHPEFEEKIKGTIYGIQIEWVKVGLNSVSFKVEVFDSKDKTEHKKLLASYFYKIA
jgi:hypothetical protein